MSKEIDVTYWRISTLPAFCHNLKREIIVIVWQFSNAVQVLKLPQASKSDGRLGFWELLDTIELEEAGCDGQQTFYRHRR